MILGLTSLRQRRKSRLIETFESHCKSFISEARIPGMAAPGAKHRRSR
jgi:hypothetical protein